MKSHGMYIFYLVFFFTHHYLEDYFLYVLASSFLCSVMFCGMDILQFDYVFAFDRYLSCFQFSVITNKLL